MVGFLILPNELVMQAMIREVRCIFVPDALRGVGSDAAVERVRQTLIWINIVQRQWRYFDLISA